MKPLSKKQADLLKELEQKTKESIKNSEKIIAKLKQLLELID